MEPHPIYAAPALEKKVEAALGLPFTPSYL
jgi:hypothetical protein